MFMVVGTSMKVGSFICFELGLFRNKLMITDLCTLCCMMVIVSDLNPASDESSLGKILAEEGKKSYSIPLPSVSSGAVENNVLLSVLRQNKLFER